MIYFNREIAHLNIGGEIFKISWRLLMKRLCSSRLTYLYKASNNLDEILKHCDDYNSEKNEYFFDRHPDTFRVILHWIKWGVLYYRNPTCVISLMDDFKYWGVDIWKMESCCRFLFRAQFYESKDEVDKVLAIYNSKFKYSSMERSGKWYTFRDKVWMFLEDPNCSRSAQIMTIISVLFIVVSTVTLIVSSVDFSAKPAASSQQFNSTNTTKTPSLDTQSPITEKIELICIIWFTGEYLVRLICCPNYKKFLTGFMNVIDLVAIAPFYLCLVLVNLVSVNETMSNRLDNIRQIMQLFRVLRVIRILKFARHSVGLQSLGYTLRRSYNELGMLMMFIGLGSFLFSSLVYFAEQSVVNTPFSNILITNWWAIISMTTVGYGDMAPESAFGKVIGSVCCVFGVLMISLPIPIIVSNFGEFYQEKSRKENSLRKKQEWEKAMASGCLVFENDNIKSSSFLAEENRKERLVAFLKEIETIKYIDE